MDGEAEAELYALLTSTLDKVGGQLQVPNALHTREELPVLNGTQSQSWRRDEEKNRCHFRASKVQ